MTEREAFVRAAMAGESPFSTLCGAFGISRRIGYKWLHRFEEGGLPALADQARIAHHLPHRTPHEIAVAVVQAKMAHPFWGPKKLLAVLRAERPDVSWPAVSTAHGILDGAGLVGLARGRRKWPNRGLAPVAKAPNQLWFADHKGSFVAQSKLCEPLTVSDAYSRKVLLAAPVASTSIAETKRHLTQAFCAYGLPEAMQTDNDGPFGSTGLGRLSRLSVWLMRLGIEVFRSRPGRPTDNGQHERVHETLLLEALHELRSSADSAEVILERWRKQFNEIRPHEGIGLRTPESLWHPSPRHMPNKLEDFSYAGHVLARRVRSDGSIKLGGKCLFLSEVLVGEIVGLEPGAEGGYLLHVGPIAVAVIQRDNQVVATRDRPGQYRKTAEDKAKMAPREGPLGNVPEPCGQCRAVDESSIRPQPLDNSSSCPH